MTVRGQAGGLLAAVLVLSVLAALLVGRIRKDLGVLSAIRSDREAIIFHSFLGRAPDGHLIRARPNRQCWASVFAPAGKTGGAATLRLWRAALRRVGHGIAACSYFVCPTCDGDPRGFGASLMRSIAYEPALVFGRLASHHQVLVEDGTWQHATEFPVPRSVSEAIHDIRRARGEWR